METINWYEAVAYVNALSVQAGLPQCYTLTGCNGNDPGDDMECNSVVGLPYADLVSCPGYRLPTEAEWEYATRAGSTTALWNGNLTQATLNCSPLHAGLHAVGWYAGNASASYAGCSTYDCPGTLGGCTGPQPVGGKLANPWGLYDVHGNVWEWVHDWYDDGYYATSAGMTNPIGPSTGTSRVSRGGSWTSVAQDCRSAFRFRSAPGFRLYHLGFRPARSIP